MKKISIAIEELTGGFLVKVEHGLGGDRLVAPSYEQLRGIVFDALRVFAQPGGPAETGSVGHAPAD
jgi:hypothetical protein